MRRNKIFPLFIGFLALTGASYTFAQQQQIRGIQCSDCQVGFASEQDLVDAISDIAGVDPSGVMIVNDDAPGVFQVMLQDGSHFIIEPVGLTFRHQNMVQRRLSYTEDGGLHLRSQTRMELQLRSAVHREDDVIGEMLRLGWNNFYWFRYGMEVESQDGMRYCFQPDMVASEQTGPSAISVTEDAYGNLVVIHPDGIRQRLHACAHDMVQLRDQVRAQVRQELVLNTNGTITIEVDGNTFRYRLNAQLRWSGILDEPGPFREGNRLFLRYRDGWEQEIIPLN